MPSAWAAAIWPRGIDWMPARMISQKNAASNSVNVTRHEAKVPTSIGRADPVTHWPI